MGSSGLSRKQGGEIMKTIAPAIIVSVLFVCGCGEACLGGLIFLEAMKGDGENGEAQDFPMETVVNAAVKMTKGIKENSIHILPFEDKSDPAIGRKLADEIHKIMPNAKRLAEYPKNKNITVLTGTIISEGLSSYRRVTIKLIDSGELKTKKTMNMRNQ